MTQESKLRRRGDAFSIRLTPDEREALEEKRAREGGGPRGLGPWLVWRALEGAPAPVRATRARPPPPSRERLILDLCGGSGAWSRPYAAAGYHVIVVDTRTSGLDVRTYVPPSNVWGILAAPPCTEFSLASRKPIAERDFVEGLACVNACMRIILQARPSWWALENPARGLLARFLGAPRDTWEPCDFGDAWTKATAIWGDFALPRRGPFVEPRGSAIDRATPEERAITPPGFARAFFDANP